MKTMKKIISLTMAVIMLITGTPALQASEFALDRAQLAELQKEILPDLKQNLNQEKNPVNELMDRYQEAKKNAEEMAKELNKIQLTEKQQKEITDSINQLKEKAEELAKTEEYAKFVPKKDRKAAALNDLLLKIDFDDIWNRDFGFGLGMVGVGGLLISAIIIFLYEDFPFMIPMWLGDVAAGSFAGGAALVIGAIIITLFSNAYTPIISWDLSAEETAKVFSEKPFTYLAKFENGAEYANLNNKCPQLLKDAVDIEYYTSFKVTPQNMKDKLYIGSLEWYKMTTEERAAYLHNFAERLRAESKSFRW